MKDRRQHPHLRLVGPSATTKKKMSEATQLSITCPQCGRTSWNKNDVEHGYCGNCNEYTGTPS